MGGGSTTTTNTSGSTNQISQIPAWMSNAGQQNYAYAQDIANRPLQQYQGQMVADTAPQSQQAWNLAANGGNVGQSALNASQAGYLGALGATPGTVTPTSVTAGQLATTNLSPYMNPYTRNVINATLPIMQQQLGLSQNQQDTAAASAGAFGGSRQGIQQGVTQAQGAQNMAQMAAQLNQANFAQAQAGAQGDIASRMQAALANQSNNLASQQSNQQANQAKINADIMASQGLTGVGAQQGKNLASQYAMLTGAGQAQQQQAQDQINAQMSKFSQAFNYPQQGLGLMLSSLGMTPHDVSQFGTTNQTGSTTTPPDIAGGIGGVMNTLGSIWGLSDPKAKTDITPLGNDPATGVPIKSFRFKGESSTAPKVIGPMATDIAKIAPASVAKIGGFKHVPKQVLAAATPSVAHMPAFATNTGRGPLAAPSVKLPRVRGALVG